MTPIVIKMEEAVKHYSIKRRTGSRTSVLDNDVELKYWPHPAHVVTIKEVTDN